jgi:hypothetical protein
MSGWTVSLGRAGANPERLASKAASHAALVAKLVQGLGDPRARIRHGCGKVLRHLAAEKPDRLYPHFDFFAGLLGHPNKIMQWEAILVLSHLARVDTARKFDALFEKYFAPIDGPVMITAANIIVGAARVARARPEWADRIAARVLRVGRARYATAECRRVAIGHALQTLGQIYPLLRDSAPVLRFVRRQQSCPRPAVRKKAARFLRAHGRKSALVRPTPAPAGACAGATRRGQSDWSPGMAHRAGAWPA